MQGIILAAGMGKRLKNITKNKTKCMVEVNGMSLIERMLKILDKRPVKDHYSDRVSGRDIKGIYCVINNTYTDHICGKSNI